MISIRRRHKNSAALTVTEQHVQFIIILNSILRKISSDIDVYNTKSSWSWALCWEASAKLWNWNGKVLSPFEFLEGYALDRRAIYDGRPLNSHGFTVWHTVLDWITRSHGRLFQLIRFRTVALAVGLVGCTLRVRACPNGRGEPWKG